jgi:hypothetical protein
MDKTVAGASKQDGVRDKKYVKPFMSEVKLFSYRWVCLNDDYHCL